MSELFVGGCHPQLIQTLGGSPRPPVATRSNVSKMQVEKVQPIRCVCIEWNGMECTVV